MSASRAKLKKLFTLQKQKKDATERLQKEQGILANLNLTSQGETEEKKKVGKQIEASTQYIEKIQKEVQAEFKKKEVRKAYLQYQAEIEEKKELEREFNRLTETGEE